MKSQASYIIVLIVGIFLVLFAIENAEPVKLQLFTYQFSISLSLLIILSIAVGTILSFIFSLTEFLKLKNKLRKKDEEIKKLKRKTEEEKSKDEKPLEPGSSVII